MNAAHSGGGGAVGGLLLFAVLVSLALYFLPTFIAIFRKKANVLAIGALNLFLGWSLIGWVVALVWALSKDQQQTVVVQNVMPVRPNDPP